MSTMKYTHLLGRHLVLEWAEDEGDEESNEKKLDELRRKTGFGFSSKEDLGGRKEGFDIEKGKDGEE